MIIGLHELMRRGRCLTLHWQRQRDSYGNRCRTQGCGLYW